MVERIRSAAENQREGFAIREFSDAYPETVALQRKIAEQLFSYKGTILCQERGISIVQN